MKRILLLGIFVFSAVMVHAQVDSVCVKGRYMKYKMPTDWVLDYKSDSIGNDSIWNVVINYGIDIKDLNSRIAFRILPRKTEPNNQKQTRKQKKQKIKTEIKTIGNNTGYYITTNYYDKKVSQTNKTYLEMFVTFLNNDYAIYFIFSATCNIKLLDSLRQSFIPFTESFLSINKNEINSFSPFNYSKEKSTIDSANFFGHFYKFYANAGWNITSVKDTIAEHTVFKTNKAMMIMESSNKNGVALSIDFIRRPSILLGDGKTVPQTNYYDDYTKHLKQYDYQKAQTEIKVHDMMVVEDEYLLSSDTTINFEFHYILKLDSLQMHGGKISFTIVGVSDDYLFYSYYKFWLDEYVKEFCRMNNLELLESE